MLLNINNILINKNDDLEHELEHELEHKSEHDSIINLNDKLKNKLNNKLEAEFKNLDNAKLHYKIQIILPCFHLRWILFTDIPHAFQVRVAHE